MSRRAAPHLLSPIDIARANWPTNCSHCGAAAVRVLETRPNGKAIRRRKHCEACNQRETTYEISQKQYKELEVLAKLRHVLLESGIAKAAQIPQTSKGKAKQKPQGPSCSECIHWQADACGLRFPEAGGAFAAECSCFIACKRRSC